jgi:hypothetical protein
MTIKTDTIVDAYVNQMQSLVSIGDTHGMSKPAVRAHLVSKGVKIRGKNEAYAVHKARTTGTVYAANLPTAKPMPTGLLATLLAAGNITQAEIDAMATPAPVQKPVPAPTSTSLNFAGMSDNQRKIAALKMVMSILNETSNVKLKQQQIGDLWGRSGSWVSHNQ